MVVVAVDQVDNDFGVGFAAEVVTFVLKFGAQGGKVLDNEGLLAARVGLHAYRFGRSPPFPFV